MEWILDWVRSGLLFGIVSSVILMLCPNKSYAKHIGLVVGLLFILVMLHPVMEWMEIDEQTYVSYIKDFFAVSSSERISDQSIQLYGESIAIQIEAALEEAGYSIDALFVEVLEDGSVSRIHITFGDSVGNVDLVEQYLHEIFGQEVVIQYEGNG